MSKFMFRFILLVLLSFTFISCQTTQTFNLESYDIEAFNQVDIPAGTYTIPYTIEDLSTLVKDYNATVSIRVLNRANEEIAVSGNTFTIVENEQYTVTIKLQAQGQFKEKTIIITAISSSASTITVQFDSNGGSGSFSSQTIPISSFASRPSTEPTKEGYQFLGWFIALEATDPFQFESTSLYENLTLIAKWQEIQTNQVKVSYDLNGAIQTSELFELVTKGSYASGLTVTPIYPGHIFIGWAHDQEGLHPFDLSTTPVVTGITLYAIWHIDFVVIQDSDGFTDQMIDEASVLNEGYVEQRFLLKSFHNLNRVVQEHNLNETVLEFGILYSRNQTLEYYSSNITKLQGNMNLVVSNQMPSLLIELTTEPLLSEATYFYRFFVRLEKTIIYSDISNFSTYIAVQTGMAVGLNYVVSGGYYRLDNGNTQFRPSFFVDVLDGFTATIDGAPYSDFQSLHREGFRSFITTDIANGKQYLHVFHLDFQTPDVVLTLSKLETNSGDLFASFSIIFPHIEHIYYPTPTVGVIYSTTHPFLKLTSPSISMKPGTFDKDSASFVTSSAIQSGSQSFYIRGYATMNGKTNYSQKVYQVQKNVEGNYEVVKEFTVIEEEYAPYSHSWNFGSSNTARVYQSSGSTMEYTSHTVELHLDLPGQYFVTFDNSTLIFDILIRSLPNPTGIEDGHTYTGSVFASLDGYDPYWYYSFNGGDYIYLPARIRFSTVGYYDVYYRGSTGIIKISFSIE